MDLGYEFVSFLKVSMPKNEMMVQYVSIRPRFNVKLQLALCCYLYLLYTSFSINYGFSPYF